LENVEKEKGDYIDLTASRRQYDFVGLDGEAIDFAASKITRQGMGGSGVPLRSASMADFIQFRAASHVQCIQPNFAGNSTPLSNSPTAIPTCC
jgi:hypothetical protein